MVDGPKSKQLTISIIAYFCQPFIPVLMSAAVVMDATVVIDTALVIDTVLVVDIAVVMDVILVKGSAVDISFEITFIVLLALLKVDTLVTWTEAVVSSPLAEVVGSAKNFTTWLIINK